MRYRSGAGSAESSRFNLGGKQWWSPSVCAVVATESPKLLLYR